MRIKIAYTPDSDDAFVYYAWEHGRIDVAGLEAEFFRDHIGALNRAACDEAFDVVAVSSAFYPQVAHNYAILSVGNSICRNCGPVLVSQKYRIVEQLRRRTVGVADHPTTGSCLAHMYVPDAEMVVWRYDAMIDAIARGKLDSGVMIHEEIAAYKEANLNLVCDLGQAWYKETRLPLPVGLNLVRRSLGATAMRDVATACESSLLWGLEHADEAYRFASHFGRGLAREHRTMFNHLDSLRVRPDVRAGLRAMFDQIATRQLGPEVTSIELVAGATDDAKIMAQSEDGA